MKYFNFFNFIFLYFFTYVFCSCNSHKQLYADRIIDKGSFHKYVNDSLDFSINYLDVIYTANQSMSGAFKKSLLPKYIQNAYKKSLQSKDEILFHALRKSMSDEEIIAIVYKNNNELPVFLKNIYGKISPIDSIKFLTFQSVSGYKINSPTFKNAELLGSKFIQNKPFNSLKYWFHYQDKYYKGQEFHIRLNQNYVLRLIWVTDIANSNKFNNKDWQNIEEQNHYVELFSLNDSAKFRLNEIIPQNPFSLGLDAFNEFGYLGAVNTLLDYEDIVNSKGTQAEKNIYYQALNTYLVFLGDYKKALTNKDKVFGNIQDSIPIQIFDDCHAEDASTYIIKSIENCKVVMINESHTEPRSRALLRDLLKGFYDKGFRYLTIEALSKDDSLQIRKFPVKDKSGFYIKEPVFGQAVREAIELGFEVNGYDDNSVDPATREKKQAANIYKLIQNDTNAKVLVWGGHSHIYELPFDQDIPRMAYYFKELSHIDPFTIETTKMNGHSDEKYESGYYRAAIQKMGLKNPFIIKNLNSNFVQPNLKNKVDIQVFFPKTADTLEYPEWLSNSKSSYYDLFLQQEHFKNKLLEIFIKSEYDIEIDNAIPVMNISLNSLGIYKLFLKPNKYIAVIRDESNFEYFYKEFEIK